ncbi:MAG: lipid-A-disaccharide synthase [Phycisphaerales bacterium]|nr:lipid-A-disaccharide synthase [Phycisphaerales bacterium]
MTELIDNTGLAAGQPPRIFISAAEPSGDRHAAELIGVIRQARPDAQIFGVAGPLMQAAGCHAIDDLTKRSAMLLGALRLAGHAWRLVRRVYRELREKPADLAILVDSPALHLPMARKIKAAGCPVLYYIAPQLWAWAPWRIGRVRRRVDRLAVILPFEEEYFRQRGVEARFVGHPLISQLSNCRPAAERVEELKSTARPLIACLPGSRHHVIAEVLPGQIEVCRTIAREYEQAGFLFAAADDSAERMIRQALVMETFHWRVERQSNSEILSAATLALVASGTATLETAWYGVPMVVMYNGSKWGYRLIGRWLVRTPHLSLVNILAGRRIVPEFMPYYTSTEPIAAEALDLLANDQRRRTMQADLASVIASLGTSGAAGHTAQIAMNMIG